MNKFAIKIATVNPIPAALPVATRSMFLAPSGISPILNFLAASDVRSIPMGLPSTRPKKIPQAIGELIADLTDSFDISTPVFAKAKIGTITKLLHG